MRAPTDTTCHKEVLTTGEVARICHVAPRTVSKWFDAGDLRGYRIPGSRDRRIPRRQLLAFMKAHGIPLDGLEDTRCRVLIVDAQPPLALAEAMNGSGRFQVRTSRNGFEAGLAAQEFRPHVMVIAVDGRPEAADEICRDIRATEALQSTKVVLAGVDRSAAMIGFDAYLPKPYSLSELMRVLDEVVPATL